MSSIICKYFFSLNKFVIFIILNQYEKKRLSLLGNKSALKMMIEDFQLDNQVDDDCHRLPFLLNDYELNQLID